tara:strand:- start:166 stop:285 length:120 start_codon:yes stop_codon:yes gene_type:complete
MEELFIQLTNASSTVFEFTYALGMVLFCFFAASLMFGRE